MANVFDVAAYILEQRGPMTTWKLQKLAYYAQAWSLVWDDDAIFPEEIQAWANGPVVRELYNAHRGKFRIGVMPSGSSEKLTAEQKDTIELVLEFYGDKTPQWLSDLTHMESPWKETRSGLSDGARTDRVIPKEQIAEYYGSL